MHEKPPPIIPPSITDAELRSSAQTLASELARFQANPRVTRITIAISPDACTHGREIQGTYQKVLTPPIPLAACSRPGGCTCRYMPVLKEIIP